MGFTRVEDIPLREGDISTATLPGGWYRIGTSAAYYHVKGLWHATAVLEGGVFVVQVQRGGIWHGPPRRFDTLDAAMLHAEALVALAM